MKQILQVSLILFSVFSIFVYLFAKKINVTQSPVKADLIVCLGGGYVERLNKGIQLYKEGFADKIVFTGSGIGTIDKNDQFGFWKIPFFEEHGIIKNDIFFLKCIKNTYAEIKSIKEYMQKYGYKTVLIVSDPPHSNRIQYLVELFQYKKNNLKVKIIASDVWWWNQNKYFDSFRSFWEAMKEVLGMGYYYIRYTFISIQV
jgi:uncharacterized SAM-binding protein YcdF (DUF218 family)